VSNPKPPRLCANGDGKKHYANGYCQACYMQSYRGGGAPLEPEEEVDSNTMAGAPLAQSDLDELLSATASRYPTSFLAVDPQEDDTDGVRRMRQRLSRQVYLARREIVRIMLFDGYESWQIKNEFLVRPELLKRFVAPLRDPDRILDDDIASIKAEGRLNPLARYVDGIKRALRRANAFADDSGLSAKERSSWAKSADDMQRNLAILEKAIHVVPGHGDMPVTGAGMGDPDEDDGEYDLPDVEEDDDNDTE